MVTKQTKEVTAKEHITEAASALREGFLQPFRDVKTIITAVHESLCK